MGLCLSNEVSPYPTGELISKLIVLQTTPCLRQIDNGYFVETKDYLYKDEIYYGTIIYKPGDRLIVSVGFVKRLQYEVFVAGFDKQEVQNIMRIY